MMSTRQTLSHQRTLVNAMKGIFYWRLVTTLQRMVSYINRHGVGRVIADKKVDVILVRIQA